MRRWSVGIVAALAVLMVFAANSFAAASPYTNYRQAAGDQYGGPPGGGGPPGQGGQNPSGNPPGSTPPGGGNGRGGHKGARTSHKPAASRGGVLGSQGSGGAGRSGVLGASGSGGGDPSVNGVSASSALTRAHARGLPFTGLDLMVVVLLGSILLAAGLVLRVGDRVLRRSGRFAATR